MTTEQYILMCEQFGWEIEEDELPVDPSTLSLNTQSALLLLNVLPDKWEGMNGVWLGKDYSGLETIMNIYEMDNRREIFELLQIGEQELGKYYSSQRKEQESRVKKG